MPLVPVLLRYGARVDAIAGVATSKSGGIGALSRQQQEEQEQQQQQREKQQREKRGGVFVSPATPLRQQQVPDVAPSAEHRSAWPAEHGRQAADLGLCRRAERAWREWATVAAT